MLPWCGETGMLFGRALAHEGGEEVPEPVFQGQPGARLTIRLNPEELESLRRLASERGLEEAVLIREWVLERLHQS
jgi:hypothetical protein